MWDPIVSSEKDTNLMGENCVYPGFQHKAGAAYQIQHSGKLIIDQLFKIWNEVNLKLPF